MWMPSQKKMAKMILDHEMYGWWMFAYLFQEKFQRNVICQKGSVASESGREL